MQPSNLCTCEEVPRGPLGLLNSNERVARVVVNPSHIAKKGGLKPGLFPPSHIKTAGLSLVRVDLISLEELKKLGNAIASVVPVGKDGAQPKLAGFVTCLVESLRKEVSTDADHRTLCVHDDPTEAENDLPENPAHAIAVGTLVHDDSEIERIRLRMIDLFTPLMQAENVYL